MLLLLAVFIVVPLVELYVILQVGHAIGIWNTLGLLIVVSVAGAWLMKHEGFGVLRRIREQLERGQMPTNELVDGAIVLAGGLLMLTPGFVTDVVGILMLLPPTRAVMRTVVKRRFRIVTIQRRGPWTDPDDVIDV